MIEFAAWRNGMSRKCDEARRIAWDRFKIWRSYRWPPTSSEKITLILKATKRYVGVSFKRRKIAPTRIEKDRGFTTTFSPMFYDIPTSLRVHDCGDHVWLVFRLSSDGEPVIMTDPNSDRVVWAGKHSGRIYFIDIKREEWDDARSLGLTRFMEDMLRVVDATERWNKKRSFFKEPHYEIMREVMRRYMIPAYLKFENGIDDGELNAG